MRSHHSKLSLLYTIKLGFNSIVRLGVEANEAFSLPIQRELHKFLELLSKYARLRISSEFGGIELFRGKFTLADSDRDKSAV